MLVFLLFRVRYLFHTILSTINKLKTSFHFIFADHPLSLYVVYSYFDWTESSEIVYFFLSFLNETNLSYLDYMIEIVLLMLNVLTIRWMSQSFRHAHFNLFSFGAFLYWSNITCYIINLLPILITSELHIIIVWYFHYLVFLRIQIAH